MNSIRDYSFLTYKTIPRRGNNLLGFLFNKNKKGSIT